VGQPVRKKYSKPAIVLHWLVGVLILAQIALGWYMIDLPKNTDARAFWINFHKSLGVTIAIFIVLRIWWRASHRPPSLEAVLPAWQVTASKLSHFLLYACMVIMPVSGYVGSSFSKYGVKFWGIKLPNWGWEDKALREIFVGVHDFTVWVLVTVLAVHVLAALKHLLVDRDGVFMRMTP
jgi:cytochrome b561